MNFTFFDSYFEAGVELTLESRRQFNDAIVCYANDFDTPTDLNAEVKAMLKLVQPIIDKSKQRSHSGKSKQNQTQNKTESKQNQTQIKRRANTSDGLGVGLGKEPPTPFLAEPVENSCEPVLASTLDAIFLLLWESHPKPTKKPLALKTWREINPDKALCIRILLAVESQKCSESWLRDDGRYIPGLAKWLANQGWEDVLPLAKKLPKELPEHIAQAYKLLGQVPTDER